MIRSVHNCLNIEIPRIDSGRSDEGIELRCLGLLKKEGGCRASNERGLILFPPDSTSENEGWYVTLFASRT
jgi:hypothetical protein